MAGRAVSSGAAAPASCRGRAPARVSRTARLSGRAAVLLGLLVLCSCAGGRPYLAVLQGNTRFRRGEDTLATYSYLRARAGAGGRPWEPWIEYDLGTTYTSLGELSAGTRVLQGPLQALVGKERLDHWEKELHFRVSFNRGVAHFEMGSYGEAVKDFVQALRLKPQSWDAKVNLELSIRASQARPLVLSEESRQEPDPRRREEISRVLANLHEEEKPIWVSAPAPEAPEKDW
jgi:tetratricopeptide (TPR) repeat protein